jgi:drug/metabolite transporter (DMT)-like permease
MALQGTTSSTYILVIRCFGWFSIFFALIRLKRLSFSLFWISTALFLLGYTLLFIDPFTPWHTSWKIWTILASLSFASYSWLGQRYRSKVKILWRYQYYQFFIHLYAALWGTVALLLAPHSFSLPSPQILLLCILFAIIFTGLPHLLFAYLIRTIKDTTYLFGLALSGVFLLTLSTELFFFQTYPSLFKILAIFAIYISLGVLYYSYHHLGAKKEE